jgi:sec-independent protein translocase protein TatA
MTASIAQFAPVPGGMELIIILFIILLLFGANKVPKLARSTGQAMGEFQKGRESIESELEEMRTEGVDEDEGADDEELTFDDDATDAEERRGIDAESESADESSASLDKESAA